MKKVLMASLLMVSLCATAQDKKDQTPSPTLPVAQPKMTTKDAKKTCKEEGKTGPELIQCMKDKKEEK